jgi:hypothetical protein
MRRLPPSLLMSISNAPLCRPKHLNIVQSRIENNLKPTLGEMRAGKVQPRNIDVPLQIIAERRAPTY